MSRSEEYSTVIGLKLSHREILNSHWFKQYLPSNTKKRKKCAKNLAEFFCFKKFQKLIIYKNYVIFLYIFTEVSVVWDGVGGVGGGSRSSGHCKGR